MVAETKPINSHCKVFLVCVYCHSAALPNERETCKATGKNSHLLFYFSLYYFPAHIFFGISCLKLSAQSFSLRVYCLEFVVFNGFSLRGYGLLLYFVGLCIYGGLLFTHLLIRAPDVKIESHP